MKGTAHVYGDNIDTDRIIPGKYTKTLDVSTLAAHVMEDLDPDFLKKFKTGDMVVAGDNFGCGSSREQAPVALKIAATGFIVSHNHPSGNLKPSRQDEELTMQLKQAAAYVDIKLLDHIIVDASGREFYSFADEGLL